MDIGTRARVLTDGVFSWCANGMNSSFVHDKIKSALQAVRDEAIEESCKVICTRCKERTPVDDQGYHDLGNGVTVACSARNIRLLKERKEP